VPIHEHIIEQGFLDMVRRVGSGPLFYNLDETPRANVDPLKPSRSRAATARAHLSDWVRELGVKDPAVSPTHAWRHTFKQRAARNGIAENLHDEITPASEGRKYTVPTVEDMAAALRNFPGITLWRPKWPQLGPRRPNVDRVPVRNPAPRKRPEIGGSENGPGRPGYHSNFS
jgi:hypothetical protein